MAVAIISDLHSNLEGLEAVLKDIESQGVKNVYCLGDVVGYGADPREVIKHCMTFDFTLKGNHEDGVLNVPLNFHKEARTAIDWTRDQLNSLSAPKEENYKLWDFLGSLPDRKEEDNGEVLYVHATPRDHAYEYIRPIDANDFEKMSDIFDHIKKICFYGHTHEPGIFASDTKFYFPEQLERLKFKLAPGVKYLVNVGSTGQPRDSDTRACYVIFRGDELEFRKVRYDYEKTIAKILKTNVIPPRFAYRLREGK